MSVEESINYEVCVIMTTYNPTQYLLEQVESIFCQEGVSVELIIRDDASTDKKYLESLKNLNYNITIIEGKENLGVADNIKELLNYIIDYKKEYKYFAYCDQDDVWFYDKLYKGIIKINHLKKTIPALYYTNLLVTDSNLVPSHELFKRGVVKNTLGQGLSQVFLFACTSIFNFHMVKYLLEYDFESIGFDSLLYYVGIVHDNIYYEDNPSLFYRQHGNNVSGQKEKGIIYLKNKILDILNFNKKQSPMQSKAIFLRDHMSGIMTSNQIKMVDQVVNYNNVLGKIKLISNSNIQAGYFPKDIYRWLRIIISRY